MPRILRKLLASLLMLGSLALTILVATPAAGAAPATVFGQPREISKVTLADTSIDGPALWTSPTGAVRAAIAWTGTDAVHHLNIMYSSDGVHYRDKYVLGETSLFRPAVVMVSSDAGASVLMAWVGTDAYHSLNVLSGVPGRGYVKVTLRETSFTAPSLAINGGTVYLAWAGTDSNHSINVLPLIWRGGLGAGTKTTLWQFSSVARPSIMFDPNASKLILSWTAPTNRIAFATSADGVKWTIPGSSPIREWSDVGPYMAGVATNNMPRYFLTWRGLDARHSVNVQYTESFPSWPLDDSKGILPESAYGGPVTGFVGTYRQVIVAWTGMDSAHHLNIGVVAM